MTGLHLAVDGSGLERARAGIGVYTKEILHAMAVDRPDCRFTVYVPAGAAAPRLAQGVAYRPLPDAPLVGRHVQWPARIRRLRPDAYFGPAGALPLGRVGCPTIITVHDLAIYRNPAWFPSRQPLSTRLVIPRSLSRADVIIAVSNNTAKDLKDLFGVPASAINVVPQGVSSIFRPLSAEDLAAARARLKLPERFILFVGTIEPRKNLVTLLEGWAMLRNRPDLVIVGAWGWLYEGIRERMGRLGEGVRHIEGLDPTELPAVYNLARVLAHPAWYEGFGLPPLEAMACGTPVVVSDRSSLPELVADGGIVAAADDPEAWRRALEKVIEDSDLAADLKRRGILRAAQFSWPRSAGLTWRAVDRAINGSAA
ncbi:MAG: glycosyltransferase family 4 protein [Candidatus Dormibacteraeota bacterium]|nr:glycosyltransferase family 4 protein [Candidatus Dormibacteraeota bacterium]